MRLATFMAFATWLAGGSAIDVTSPHVCPELDSTHRCTCAAYKVTCGALGAVDLTFLRPFPPQVDRLFVSHNNLFSIAEGALADVVNVTTLSLQNNRIARFEVHALGALKSLLYLDLSYNEIQEFDLSSVTLPRLRSLDLSYNLLVRFKLNPRLPSLKSVLLDVNRLSVLDDSFALPNAIDKLKLSENNVGNNLGFLRNLPHVLTLWLHENNISSIRYKTFEMNKKLLFLRLDVNSVSSVDFLEDLPLLKGLNLTSNRISVIPGSTFVNMSDLQSLYLGHNLISDTKFIKHVNNKLHSLNLSNNKISHINSSYLEGKVEMNRLILSSNELTDISFISGTQNMETLTLDNNRLRYISDFQFNNTKVSYLDVSSNMIENIGFVSHSSHLRTLIMSENKLGKINFKTFEDSLIEMLDLSCNRLENIDFVRNMPSIKELFAAKNKLSYLPEDIFRNNAALEKLNISENPIKDMKFVFYASRIRTLIVSNCSIQSRDDSPLKCSRSVEVTTGNRNTTISFIESTDKLWEECYDETVTKVEISSTDWRVLITITMLSLICLTILLSIMLMETVIRCRQKLKYSYEHIENDVKRIPC